MPLPHSFSEKLFKNKKPLVSVIIPTYNEEKDISQCLDSIEKQSYGNIETIVVDDGSTDKTREIVSRYKKVRIVPQNHQGPGAARNLGAKKAKGEILVLIDADMILFPDYVEKLTLPIINNETLGTIESIQYNIHDTKMQECWGKEVRTVQLEGVNSATVRGIARENFLNLGGFDKKYGYADDRTFFLKYGIRFLILKDVKCYHKTPPNAKGVYKHSRWIGASLRKGLLKYKAIRIVSPFFLIALSPIVIFILSLKKCYENKNFRLFFPWMILFMIARYFGTVSGIFRESYLGVNVR
ncbi:MAG: glycosyltransferase family 2 protein [Nanoarchaeota archaeon]